MNTKRAFSIVNAGLILALVTLACLTGARAEEPVDNQPQVVAQPGFSVWHYWLTSSYSKQYSWHDFLSVVSELNGIESENDFHNIWAGDVILLPALKTTPAAKTAQTKPERVTSTAPPEQKEKLPSVAVTPTVLGKPELVVGSEEEIKRLNGQVRTLQVEIDTNVGAEMLARAFTSFTTKVDQLIKTLATAKPVVQASLPPTPAKPIVVVTTKPEIQRANSDETLLLSAALVISWLLFFFSAWRRKKFIPIAKTPPVKALTTDNGPNNLAEQLGQAKRELREERGNTLRLLEKYGFHIATINVPQGLRLTDFFEPDKHHLVVLATANQTLVSCSVGKVTSSNFSNHVRKCHECQKAFRVAPIKPPAEAGTGIERIEATA